MQYLTIGCTPPNYMAQDDYTHLIVLLKMLSNSLGWYDKARGFARMNMCHD